MNKRIEKFANIWANRRYEDKGTIYYAFSEKALDVFSELLIKEVTNLATEHVSECSGVTYGIDKLIYKEFDIK